MTRRTLQPTRGANAVEYIFLLVAIMIATAAGYRMVSRAANGGTDKAKVTLDGQIVGGGGAVAANAGAGGAAAGGGAAAPGAGAAAAGAGGTEPGGAANAGAGGAGGAGAAAAGAGGGGLGTSAGALGGAVAGGPAAGAVAGGAGGGGAAPATAQRPGFFSRVGSGARAFGSGAVSFGQGVVVDGLWGTVKGTAELGYNLVTHPIDTTTAIAGGAYNAVRHPVDTYNAIASGVRQEFQRDPARAAGNLVFQVASVVVPVSRANTVARLGRVAEGAEALAPEARIAAAARRAREAERVAMNDCPGGICMRPGQCFAAGTPVLTADGAKPIETVAAGDLVLARDPESGETTRERVAQTFVREADVADLTLRGAEGEEHVVVTLEHPFHVHGRGFRGVSDLAPGDEVDTASGTAKVVALASLPDRRTVYNFEVEHAHTYFVGKTGAWVHNACTPPLAQGDHVLVPRSDGSVSGGRVVADAGNNRVVVEVRTATGETGQKVIGRDELTRRRDLGEIVEVPRSNGGSSIGTVVARHDDGRVTVAWQQNGQEASKTLHESQLRNVDPDRTLPPGAVQRPAAPAAPRTGPYVAAEHGYYRDRLFMDYTPPHVEIPSEGWKLHVSANPANAHDVADRVLPVLREMNVPHKVMADPGAYGQMTGGQAGKFITIYPTSPEQAASVAREIDRRVAGLNQGAPVIAGERPIGDSGMVYGRYGGFTKDTVTDPRTGREVPDVRGQVAPSWVRDPFHH